MAGPDSFAIALLTASPGVADTPGARALAATLAEECRQDAGMRPEVRFIHLGRRGQGEDLEAALHGLCEAGHTTVLVLPGDTGLDIFAKRMTADAVSAVRRSRPGLHVFYDETGADHPLLLQAWVDAVVRTAAGLGLSGPNQLGLLLAASGDTDPETRAASYKLMRLLWEHTGAAHAEVAFVRHDRPLLPVALPALAARPLRWVAVAEYLWPCEHLAFARTVLADFAAARGEAPWPLTGPLAAHPNVAAWFKLRATDLLWSLRLKTQKPAVRVGGTGLTVTVRPAPATRTTSLQDTL